MVISNLSANYSELSVIGKIKKNLDLSAISCINAANCLIASDEATFVQRAKIVGESLIVSKAKVKLGKYKSENDIEGLANDGKSFYAVGSHGLSRKSSKLQSSRFQFFKIDFIGEKSFVKAYDLNGVLSNQSVLSQYFKKPLSQNGINIEGLAFKNGALFLGFRGPIINGKAHILSFNLNAFFKAKEVESTLRAIDLGKSRGIRSLEFNDKLLYIAAGANDVNLNSTSVIKSYSLEKDQVIDTFFMPLEEQKLEGITFLEKGKVITVFDSLTNGNPLSVELF